MSIMKIGIVDAKFFAFHGVYEEEQLMGNDFIVNVEVDYELPDEIDEKLEHTIDYQIIYNVVKYQMGIKRKLLETVVQQIAKELLANHSKILVVKVRIDKCIPQLAGPLKSTFVEFVKHR
jgi:7,8-dihydroneopterin aldolase/epimerase/oxygenase